MHLQTHRPRGTSGSVSRGAVGTGEGTVGVGVGAIHKEIVHTVSVFMHVCNVYGYLLCFSQLPEIFWEGRL